MAADRPAGRAPRPAGDRMPPSRPGLGAAPRSAMDHNPVLPRRGLSIGAVGEGNSEARYEILAPIDRGGMGELFLAEMTGHGGAPTLVVVKRLLAELVDDPKYVAMFQAEARVMGELHHENIVRLVDTPIVDRAQCLAMEYVRGKNVQQLLARCETLGPTMPPGVVLRIMIQVLRGLDYAHTFHLADGTPLNLVHRDVSPGNILVSQDGSAKLTDFGIAKSQMSAVSTTVGIVKGKARYLAPEQILGEVASPRSDIFSAAAVVVEMLTGLPLFDRASVPKTLYAIVNGTRPELEKQLPFRAPLLVQTLDRALEVDPKHRLSSAREFAEALEAAARLLGRPVDAEGLGGYVVDLFRGVDDPLTRFDHREREDDPTVHAYRPPTPPPAEHGERRQPTEIMRQRASEPAETLQSIHVPVAPPARRRSSPPPLPPPPSEMLLGGETPVIAPAHGAGPTQIVRGTPIDSVPSDEASEPKSDSDVDEALSVLAWLQSRQAERREDTKPLGDLADMASPPKSSASEVATKPRTQSASPAPRTVVPQDVSSAESDAFSNDLASLKPKRGAIVWAFVLGIACGVGATWWLRPVPPPPPPAPVLAPPPAQPERAAPVEEEEAEPEVKAPEPEEEAKPNPYEAAPPASVEITFPKGARIRVNGTLVEERVPAELSLPAGAHTVKVYRRGYKKEVSLEVADGERYELSKKLRRLEPGEE